MIIKRSGVTIRIKVADLRVLGRNTQGVKLIDLKGKDSIASITKVPTTDEDESTEAEGENINPESNNSVTSDTNTVEQEQNND
jgi:DNA gyrase subunit A